VVVLVADEEALLGLLFASSPLGPVWEGVTTGAVGVRE
jgi:hypothetical protein